MAKKAAEAKKIKEKEEKKEEAEIKNKAQAEANKKVGSAEANKKVGSLFKMIKKKKEVVIRPKIKPKSACDFKELPPPLPEKLLGVVMDKTKELSIIVT